VEGKRGKIRKGDLIKGKIKSPLSPRRNVGGEKKRGI
jgi:hypothetical protein